MVFHPSFLLFLRKNNILEKREEDIMSKNKIITSLIIGAILFSSLAAFLIYHYMSPSRGTMYVFNDSYSAGDQLTADMLTPVQVDSTIIVAGKRTNASAQFVTPNEYQALIRSGDSLRMDVSEGMPLTTSMLSVSGGSTVEMNMKSDAIAVTVAVDEYTGITNDLKEGSHVNIYANINSQTTLIQQNKRILEVFKENGTITGVSIEENIQESMELIYAVTNGNIYLGLVDATGYQAAEGSNPSYTPYNEVTATDNNSITEENTESEVQTETVETETETAEAPADENTVFTP